MGGTQFGLQIPMTLLGFAGSGLHAGNLHYVYRIIRPGIVAVEEVEELREGINLPALVEFERAGNAQVRLNVRRAAEFVEAGIHAVHINAPGVVRRR